MILHTVSQAPGVALFKIEGELDYTSAPTVRAALAHAADEPDLGRMVIDLNDVRVADEKGVASLATAVRKLTARHPAMRVVALAKNRWLAGALANASVSVSLL